MSSRYHKTHGHQTQQLHENGDGTFSIVNPETSAPYPGTLGMEKEKPYKCDVCGKRYKNLNGLKYVSPFCRVFWSRGWHYMQHKQHSPPCNPDLKLNSHMAAAGLGPLGMNVPGLPGIGEEGMMWPPYFSFAIYGSLSSISTYIGVLVLIFIQQKFALGRSLLDSRAQD